MSGFMFCTYDMQNEERKYNYLIDRATTKNVELRTTCKKKVKLICKTIYAKVCLSLRTRKTVLII